MSKVCKGCGVVLQTKYKSELGFVSEKVYNTALYCERCFKIIHYGESYLIDKKEDTDNLIDTVNKSGVPVIYLVDITSFNKKQFDILNKFKTKKYVVFTKRDLLPKSVKDSKLIKYVKDNYDIATDIFVVSSLKKYNIDFIYDKLVKDNVKKVYVLGYSNSGKSSLINSFLMSRGKNAFITTSHSLNTTTELINIELDDLTIIDTPGFISDSSFTNFVDMKEYKDLIPKKEIKPKIYSLKPNFMIIIDGILRIENNGEKDIDMVFYINNNLSFKKMRSIRNNDLKNLEKCSMNVEKDEDIVIEGIGFIKCMNLCEIDIYVINKCVISKRSKLI